MYGELVGRLAHGATVITPNRRLSATIRRDFDQRAFQSGSRIWPAADVIPWRTWLERSFREAFVRGAVERVLMSATQARVLWQRIIGDAPESAGLLQIRSTADAALEAWDIVHGWRLLPALQGRPLPDETHAFLRWAQAYDGARTSAVPEDLLVALEAEPRAKAFFATINAANRYAVLWRIQTAVRAETRARRIAQLVEMLARGETVHIFKPRAKA